MAIEATERYLQILDFMIAVNEFTDYLSAIGKYVNFSSTGVCLFLILQMQFKTEYINLYISY